MMGPRTRVASFATIRTAKVPPCSRLLQTELTAFDL
jgi:hypothetical protein